MYKLLIPFFALAILLFGCTKQDVSNTVNDSSDTQIAILSGKHNVILKTSMGNIEIELDADAAPKTVTNFILLAKSDYYKNLTFHRVIPDFMIQGGDPNGDGTGGESIFGGLFEDEINADSYGLNKKKLGDSTDEALPEQLAQMTQKDYLEKQGYQFNDNLKSLPLKKGYIAMANSGPNTNGSQFFIIQREDGVPWLEGRHTVFGKVTKGLDVVDAIANVERGPNDKPIKDITFDVEVID